ncbi:Nitrogen regulation protein NIFR3 [Staphylococcus aureus subsp. aureus 71193]|nr:Nitrogen regulation protein NIFR3 [Staphylococcus aureus subsp. aureus 71193]
MDSQFLQAMRVGVGPQHREFRKEILQAMRVGVRAPTQKLTKSQLTIMCKLGPDNDKEILFL